MPRRDVILERALVAIAASVAILFAAKMLAAYYAFPDLLWRGFYHDRNSHLSFGLDLALAVKTADPIWFFTELEKTKVWGPLHGLVLAVVLLIGGIDYRLAIVPSLIGWVLTIVFGAMSARRLFADRIQGTFAAAVAITLTIGSPAFRLLASDVMLEGLGAGLSAIVLWAYLAAHSDKENALRWRVLALALTLLFFHKANYWGLVAVSLAVAFLSEEPRRWLHWARQAAGKVDVSALARGGVRDPLLIAFAVIVALVAYLYWRGPTAIVLFGRNVSLYPPGNLTTAAYAVLFLRLFLAWRAHRASISTTPGPEGRALLFLHVVPVAVSFLLPKRLSAFLWFVGPSNNDWQHGYDPLGGISLYWSSFADGFHVSPWVAVLSLVLTAVAVTRMRHYPPGGRAVFVLVLVSLVGVVVHPHHQGRFLASWLFSVWIAAGAGAAVLLDWLLPKQSPGMRTAVAAAAVALLIVPNAWQKPSPLSYGYAIHPTSGPSDVDLVRPYLPALANARAVGFATTFGMSRLFHWVIRQNCRRRILVEDPWIHRVASRDEARNLMADRIARSNAELFVVIDAPNGRYALPIIGWTYDHMVGIVEAMNSQTRFVRVATYSIPAHGAHATIWKRRQQ